MEQIISNLVFPNPAFLVGIIIFYALDLLTGIFKSKKKGVATASVGFDKSINKMITYLSLIVLSFTVTNLAHITYDLEMQLKALNVGLDSVCLLILYREIKSILENLIVANTDNGGNQNEIAKFLIPIHNTLILKFNKDFSYNETKKDIIKKLNK